MWWTQRQPEVRIIPRRHQADPDAPHVVIDLDKVEGMLGLNAEGKPNFLRLAREG